jgi:hypothetical protein
MGSADCHAPITLLSYIACHFAPLQLPAVSLLLRVEAREGQELEAAVGAVEQVLRDRVTPSVIRTMWDVGSAHVTWSLPG